MVSLPLLLDVYYQEVTQVEIITTAPEKARMKDGYFTSNGRKTKCCQPKSQAFLRQAGLPRNTTERFD